jgi:hypothetical protein
LHIQFCERAKNASAPLGVHGIQQHRSSHNNLA